MPKITRDPTAEELYSARDNIAKAALDKALAEARELGRWAGRRVPNGPTSGFMTQGYVIGHTGDLDLAIAMIVARVRSEAITDFITRNSVSHELRIKPGVMVAGTLSKLDDYAKLPKPREMARARNARQLAVRKTGKCDNCGAEFVDDRPGLLSGPAKRTPKQWSEAFRAVGNKVKPARKARGALTDALQPEAAAFGRDWSGPDQSLPVPKGSGFNPRAYRARRSEAAKEKIPSHKGKPTGKSPGSLKGKRK